MLGWDLNPAILAPQREPWLILFLDGPVGLGQGRSADISLHSGEQAGLARKACRRLGKLGKPLEARRKGLQSAPGAMRTVVWEARLGTWVRGGPASTVLHGQ